MTQKPGGKRGASGLFRAIRPSRSKPRRWKWPRKPGPATDGGGSAAATFGTPSLMTRPPAWSSSARRGGGGGTGGFGALKGAGGGVFAEGTSPGEPTPGGAAGATQKRESGG